jgi:SAM-dependent methyltransferase
LRSFRKVISQPFSYTGADSATLYIELARQAFRDDPNASFKEADVFDLPFEEQSFDVTLCNNVLLHLPSVRKPMEELCRVSRRLLVIRTLVGERSFLIKEVRQEGTEFDDRGDPIHFNYYNIYASAFLKAILERQPRFRSVDIIQDRDFDPTRIEEAAQVHSSAGNPTRIFDGWQVNGYVLQPWAFVIVELAEE